MCTQKGRLENVKDRVSLIATKSGLSLQRSAAGLEKVIAEKLMANGQWLLPLIRMARLTAKGLLVTKALGE